MKAHLKRNWFWYLIIILLISGNLYFYSAQKWSEREARIKFDEAQISNQNKITTILEQNHIEEIKRQSTFYASLVQKDIYEKNWNQVRNQFQHITRVTMMTGIEFIEPAGQVKVASNERLEGNQGIKDLPANLFSEDRTTQVLKTDRGYTVSVPVYENTLYLGRLLLHHSLLTTHMTPMGEAQK